MELARNLKMIEARGIYEVILRLAALGIAIDYEGYGTPILRGNTEFICRRTIKRILDLVAGNKLYFWEQKDQEIS